MEAERHPEDPYPRHVDGLKAAALTALLDIEGELLLERDGIEAMRIEASGPLVRAQIYRVSTAFGLVRTLHLPSRSARRQVSRAAALLATAGISMEVWIGRRRVAQLGSGARTGLLERVLGLKGLQLHVRSTLLAMLSVRSGSHTPRGRNP